MKNKTSVKRIYPHLIAFSGFILIAFLYASPLLNGKRLAQHDSVQAQGAAQELINYRQKTGKQALWTNSMFGGMPGYMISSDYPNSLTTHLGRLFTYLLPEPANLLVLLMGGCYVLLMALGTEVWLGALGAIAFAFCSANFTSIEAGHVSKVIAIAYAPPLIGGVILAFRGRYLLGGALTALFLGLQLYGNHVQITYYTYLALLLLGGFELVWAVRANRTSPGRLRQYALASGVLVGASLIAVGTHASRLWTNYEYSQVTQRGKSELTISADTTQRAAVKPAEGLDRDYAFNWSYGIPETLTLLIPNFHGGATYGAVGKSSNTVGTLVGVGVNPAQARQFAEQLPLYWGDQPGTGGPVYAGAVVLFLFVLGMLLIKDPIKWWALTVAGLFIVLAWGKNFGVVNNLMFDYFPLYNKFRAVTMLLNLAQIFIVVVAVLGVQELTRGGWKAANLRKPLLRSAGTVGGVCLLFALAGGVFFDFSSLSDPRTQEGFAAMFSQGAPADQAQASGIAGRLMGSIRDDRADLLRTDAFRSLVFVLLAAGLTWLFANGKVKAAVLYAGLTALVLVDLFAVGKRYLNEDDFRSRSESQRAFAPAPSPADQQILQDKTPHFRVLNTANPFADANTSYFHKSVGGYHGAKLGRYNELIEFQIAKNNLAVLNMLNTRYFIFQGPDGQPVAQPNPGALGNGWFADSYRLVSNANEEIKALDGFDPKRVAVVDRRFADQLRGLQIRPDTAATLRLTRYAPDQLAYESNAAGEQLAVFSEIYYNDQKGWEAYLDGQPVPHLRADYVLRAMRLPAGKHTIEFRFEPKSYARGEQIALVSSVLLVGLLGFTAFGVVRSRRREAVAA